MDVKIIDYRGFEIMFNPDSSEFYCSLNDYGKRSKSFDTIKKGIDEYKKDNASFEPFYIILSPDSYRESIPVKVLGIRKDGRFYYDKNGKPEQISDYDEKNYWVYTEENKNAIDTKLAEIAIINHDISELHEKKNKLTKSYSFLTLNEIKAKYHETI